MRKGTSMGNGGGNGGGDDTARFFQEAGALLRIFEQCWRDDVYKKRFMEEPIPILQAEGVQVPPGVEIVVVQNDPSVLHIVLPSQTAEAPAAPPIDALVVAPLRRRCEVAGWT